MQSPSGGSNRQQRLARLFLSEPCVSWQESVVKKLRCAAEPDVWVLRHSRPQAALSLRRTVIRPQLNYTVLPPRAWARVGKAPVGARMPPIRPQAAAGG